MKSRTIQITLFYGCWVIFWLAITSYGYLFSKHGEFGVSAHIMLIITGFPSSLASLWLMPNGSLLATFVAGFLGLLQWSILSLLEK